MPSVKEDLVTLEKQFWQAMVDKDTDAALKLTNDPCIVAGAQGVSRISKEKFGEMMKAGDWTLHKFELRDIEGYWEHWHGGKGYSGVALLVSKSFAPNGPEVVHPVFDFEQRAVMHESDSVRKRQRLFLVVRYIDRRYVK